MKSVLYSVLFLLTGTNSIAQTSVSDTLIIRGGSTYYIDGIRVLGNTNLPKSALEEVSVDTLNKRCHADPIDFDMDYIKKNSRLIQLVKSDSEIVLETIEVIIGGLPGTYGDINSTILRINPVLVTPRKVTVSDKEQKLATE